MEILECAKLAKPSRLTSIIGKMFFCHVLHGGSDDELKNLIVSTVQQKNFRRGEKHDNDESKATKLTLLMSRASKRHQLKQVVRDYNFLEPALPTHGAS